MKQPWHEEHHANWSDDHHIAKFLDQHWGWLETLIQSSPPKLPATYGHLTFKLGYFEELLNRKQETHQASGYVARAIARQLAYELWVWRELDKSKKE